MASGAGRQTPLEYDPGRRSRGPLQRPRNPYVYISGVFAGAWALAAWSQPEADYVFFPLLIGGAFPLSYRLAVGALPPTFAIGAAIAGVINVIVIALFLAIAGVLGPPSLIPVIGAVGQATILGFVGGGVGFALSTYGYEQPTEEL